MYNYFENYDADWDVKYKPPGDKHKIMVYGTLRKSFGNHRLLDNDESEFIKVKRITGYKMHSSATGGVPVVEEVTDDSCVVYGEVYLVSSKVLKSLDQLEGHPHGYLRRKIKGCPDTWIYTGRPGREYSNYYVHVEHGDWKKFVEEIRKNHKTQY